MEAHGGYLVRMERFDVVDLVSLAREALRVDGGDPSDASLQISVISRRKVVRLAYDTPLTYGRAGAAWYARHHALARVLSRCGQLTVHAYTVDDDHEQVTAYGSGRKVGGERLDYADLDFPAELSDDGFDRLKERWPLGHLAYVFGVTRKELLAMPRLPSALVSLDGTDSAEKLAHLLPSHVLAAHQQH